MINQKAQSVVEFLLVILLLMFVLIGIVDFSRAWYFANSLNMAAREGARMATVTEGLAVDDPRIKTRVEDTLKPMIQPTDLKVSVIFTSPVKTGDPITVEAINDFHFWYGKLFRRTDLSVSLKGKSAMRYEMN